jgi:hypothetical protein
MAKLGRCQNEPNRFLFWCPGCDGAHQITSKPDTAGDSNGRGWDFNGDLDRPTFSPSYLVYEHPAHGGYKGHPRCHSFITDGKIAYCSDSTHALAGQTVELPEWGSWRRE